MRKGPHNLNLARRILGNRRVISVAIVLIGLSLSFAASFPILGPESDTMNPQPVTLSFLQNAPTANLSSFPQLSLPRRPIFPYSVVPGGVHSLRELKDVVTNDPTVAKHYSSLKLGELRLIRLSKARAAYVSYRLGSQIYWTKRKLKLAEGESLFTDGENTLRTRCGNLISEWPRPPTSPAEPTPSTLDTPLTADPPPVTAPPLVLFPGPGSGLFPPFVPIFPGGGPGPAPKHPPGPPPPVRVPEPATLFLMLSGLALLWATSRARNA